MVIYFPLGAGGNWLKSTLIQEPLTNKNYVNFHSKPHACNAWIRLEHQIDNYTPLDLILSGTTYFNFFVNHVYKHYHYERNLFKNTEYNYYWPTLIAASYGICKYNKFINSIYFNFDDFIDQSDVFHKKITNLQESVNKSVISYDEFFYRRAKFIQTCVNIDGLAENFNNMYWVAFVMGQLMIHKIYPTFSIFENYNQDLCKQFAQDNYHKCKLNNSINFKTEIFLPEFKL